MPMLDAILRPILFWLAKIFARMALRLRIEGLDNIPENEALLVIGNHFSLFEPPLMGLFLPRYPRFLAATESQSQPYLRHLVRIYRQIPIWRGQVDRTAMRTALDALAGGEWVGVFPEGGVDPVLQELIARGEQIHRVAGHSSRLEPRLIRARPGAAFLAVQSGVRVLPVAFVGTEQILGNLKRWRRTTVTMRVGPPFGPLILDRKLRGQAKREQLDGLGDEMMRQIAALLPVENRGVYGEDRSV